MYLDYFRCADVTAGTSRSDKNVYESPSRRASPPSYCQTPPLPSDTQLGKTCHNDSGRSSIGSTYEQPGEPSAVESNYEHLLESGLDRENQRQSNVMKNQATIMTDPPTVMSDPPTVMYEDESTTHQTNDYEATV